MSVNKHTDQSIRVCVNEERRTETLPVGEGTGSEVSGSTKCLNVYYETINREVKKRNIYECRCDAKVNSAGSTCLGYIGFREGLERKRLLYY